MPKLTIQKSKGKTLYLNGLRVFRHTDGTIHISYEGGHTVCPRESKIESFFDRILKNGG